LTEAISEVAENLNQNVYTVIWETDNHNHGSEYRVTKSGRLVNEDTLFIQGQSRSGTYEIFPKASSPPVIRYHLPSGDIGWNEEAVSLILTEGTFAYQKQDDSATFVDVVKDRLGI
jgi:hypothetical protein